MAFSIAVTNDHSHIATNTFCTESGFGERCSHGEEINRAVSVEEAAIDIYVDKDDKKGSSMVVITSADNEKTLKAKLSAAVKKALSAMNKHYPLAEKSQNIIEKEPKKLDLNSVANKIRYS